MVTEGDQVLVGDVAEGDRPPETVYEVLCRQHQRAGITAAVAATLPSAVPLPFERLAGEEGP